jgi:hypothetical protein
LVKGLIKRQQWRALVASDKDSIFDVSGSCCFREWSPGGGTPQQLSVVTTVWGVTASSQSEPHHSTTTTTTSFGIYPQPGPGNGPHKGPNVPHGYHHRQATPPYPSNGYVAAPPALFTSHAHSIPIPYSAGRKSNTQIQLACWAPFAFSRCVSARFAVYSPSRKHNSDFFDYECAFLGDGGWALSWYILLLVSSSSIDEYKLRVSFNTIRSTVMPTNFDFLSLKIVATKL